LKINIEVYIDSENVISKESLLLFLLLLLGVSVVFLAFKRGLKLLSPSPILSDVVCELLVLFILVIKGVCA